MKKINKILLAVAISTIYISGYAGVQQDKMKSCNADATTKALKGDARKAFMKDCLSAKPAAAILVPTANTQQNKMKTCNADASTNALKGDQRKAFMKTCLSKK